ncbi:hypothetical protein Ddc_01976 [Ditylenchus destructor]|nr:hypothetical protein Ddc_01976 [Ditylenchus destructor]
MTLREVDCGDSTAGKIISRIEDITSSNLEIFAYWPREKTGKHGNTTFSEFDIPLQYYIFYFQGKPPKTTSTIDIEKLDRIFCKKDKDSEHMREICIREVQFDVLLNKLGEEDRSLIVSSSEVITRTIEQFCLDISEDARRQRKHACNFVALCLHDNPPTTDESRNLWLDVIMLVNPPVRTNTSFKDSTLLSKSQGTESISNTKTMNFGRKCRKIFTEDIWPIEFKMLVLNVLEHDYAGLLQKINDNDNSHGRRVPRTFKSKDQNVMSAYDPATTPLAYLLIVSDKSSVVEALAKKYRESINVDSRKLFAGLIGLLLDILLWQHCKDSMYQECNHVYFLSSIPEQIMTEYRRARKIIGTSPDSHHITSKLDKAELQAFGNAVPVPWISALIYNDLH